MCYINDFFKKIKIKRYVSMCCINEEGTARTKMW